MSGRLPALLLATALAAGCGDSAPAPSAVVPDVQGTPFVAAKPKDPPPPAGAIGDTDTLKAGEPLAAGAAPAAAPPAAAATPAAAQAAAEPAPAAPDQFTSTSFDELSGFACPAYATDAAAKFEIPAKVAALSGKKVVLDGYMMPLQYEAGGAKKFLLMRFKFGCCYAVAPKINEWIEVTMEGGRVADYMPDTIATVWGVLEIKEETRDGVVSGLYKMRATKSELTEAR
jgi:hypothetical protein